MIENTLAAFRLPSTMLHDLRVYCEENDLNQSQVIRKSVSTTLYGDRKRLPSSKPIPQPQVVADGWAHHRR